MRSRKESSKRIHPKEKSPISYADMMAQRELFFSQFNDFANIESFVEDALGNAVSELRQPKQHPNQGTSKETRRFLALLHSEKALEMDLTYAPTLRASLFLTIYGYAERLVDKLCELTYPYLIDQEKGKRNVLVLRDLYGSGLIRSLCYLEKVVGYAFSEESKAFVSLLNKHRNILAHSHGLLGDEQRREIIKIKSDLESMLKREATRNCSNENTVMADDDPCSAEFFLASFTFETHDDGQPFLFLHRHFLSGVRDVMGKLIDKIFDQLIQMVKSNGIVAQ